MPFDIAGARAAGATDDQIKDHLKQFGDVEGALSAGASLEQIAEHVSQTPPSAIPEQKPETYWSDIKGIASDVGKAAIRVPQQAVQDISTIMKSATPWEAAGNVLGGAARIATNVVGVPVTAAISTLTHAAPAMSGLIKAGAQEVAQLPMIPTGGNVPAGVFPGAPQGQTSPMPANISIGDLGEFAKQWAQQNPRTAQQVLNAASIGNLALMGAGTRAAEPVLGVGKRLENLGKTLEAKTLPVTGKEALKSGITKNQGLTNLVNDISNFGVDSPMGLKKSLSKTNNLIEQEAQNYDNTLKRFVAADPQNAVVSSDIHSIMGDLKNDIDNGKISQIKLPADRKRAMDMVDQIEEALKNKDLGGTQFIDKLPEVKSEIIDATSPFEKGVSHITDDPLKPRIGAEAYLRVMDDLNGKIQGIGETGNNLKRLINIRKVLDEAAFKGRQGVSQKGLMATIGEAAFGAAMGAMAHGQAGAEIGGLAAPAVAYVAGKMGPSLLMKAGRKIQGKKTLGNVVSSLSDVEQQAYDNAISNRVKIGDVTMMSVPGGTVAAGPGMIPNYLQPSPSGVAKTSLEIPPLTY
jgi:hypothetical protein